jgi:hypothetical protein
LPTDHDPLDKARAMQFAMDEQTLHLGLFFKEDRPTYDQGYAAMNERNAKPGYGLPQILSKYTR